MVKQNTNTVEDYIASFPIQTQEHLYHLRKIILEKAPEAVESIAYGMPAYKTNGKPLVYFAAYKTHIGFYATPTGHAEFAEELTKFKTGKGSVQFPIDQPMPIKLIERIVEFRVKENISKLKK